MQLAALRAVAFIDKNKQFADGIARLTLQLVDKCVKVIDIAFAELVYQRAQQTRLGLPQLRHQIAPAVGAVNRFPGIPENAFDLLVQFIAVGDDGDAGMRIVFQYPLGQQHHDDAFAAALGVPDDAAFLAAHMRLRGFDAEILVRARQFLLATIEQHKVVQ